MGIPYQGLRCASPLATHRSPLCGWISGDTTCRSKSGIPFSPRLKPGANHRLPLRGRICTRPTCWSKSAILPVIHSRIIRTTNRHCDPPAGVKTITMNRHCEEEQPVPILHRERSNPFNIRKFPRQLIRCNQKRRRPCVCTGSLHQSRLPPLPTPNSPLQTFLVLNYVKPKIPYVKKLLFRFFGRLYYH